MQKHSRLTPEGRAFWLTERLWHLAAGLPLITVSIDDIPEFDQNCWFAAPPPTCREVATQARRIRDADLSYPVLLSADGRPMDGGHRLARAWLDRLAAVNAQRSEVDPAPDYVEPVGR